MSGDYTRSSFKPPKNYAGVMKQQGRVGVDADWNEGVDIQDRRWRAETVDLHGRCWVGGHTPNAFRITSPGGNDLAIAAGRMYVDGLLAENHGAPPYHNFDEVLAEAGSGNSVLFTEQPHRLDAELMPVPGRVDLIYLDVWHREITALQDGEIREVALGGPDTATRVQTVWQVRALAGVDAERCDDPITAYDEATRPSGGRVTTSTVAPAASEDPCIVSPAGGYRGVENCLYRLEIHRVGDLGTARFKWSRNNASVFARVEAITAEGLGFRLILSTLGRDEVLRFDVGDLIEVLDDRRELDGVAGEMARVVGIDEANRELQVTPANAADWTSPTVGFVPARAEMNTRVIRWDHASTDSDLLLALEPGPIALEDGVLVTFSGANFRVKDYWHFAARTADGSVEAMVEAPARDIHHHYCRLALVQWQDGEKARIEDCRPRDRIHSSGESCCTVVVHPGQDIQSAIDSLPPEGGCVCLKSGVHVITAPIRIERNDVVLEGESPGAQVLGSMLPLLLIGNAAPRAARVDVHGIKFETSGQAQWLPDFSHNLDIPGQWQGPRAIITLMGCGDVQISNCAIVGQEEGLIAIVLGQADRIVISGCSIQVLLYGIGVLEDSFQLRVQDNRIQSSAVAEGEDDGLVGVFLASALAPCLVTRNWIEGFRVGVALTSDPFSPSAGLSGANGSEVSHNHIRRFTTTQADGHVRLYAIDVAATDCLVSHNAITIPPDSSIYSGIRATGSGICIGKNTITSSLPTSDTVGYSVGILVGSAVDRVRVANNTILGADEAILVVGSSGAVVEGNHIASQGRGPRYGVALYMVRDGSVQNNRITNAEIAIWFLQGERNHARDNHIERGFMGVLVQQDNAVEVAGNCFVETGGPAIQVESWHGTARLHRNRCQSCGWRKSNGSASILDSMKFSSASILAWMGLGELQVESCEIRDTGLSPEDGTVRSPSVGLLGHRVIQASVQSNIIGPNLAPPIDDASGSVQRAVYLDGLFDLIHTDVTDFPQAFLPDQPSTHFGCLAQLLDNRFSGIGNAPVVEIAEFTQSDELHARFNRVQYSDNFCWHYNTERDTVSVSITAAAASAMGNHFKSLAPAVPIDFGATAALYIGNVAQDGTQATGSSILPTPQNTFNR